MTGFASKTLLFTIDQETKVNMTINLKTLNSRFFEVTAKLPYSLGNLETVIIKRLKTKLHRGQVYITIHVDSSTLFKGSVKPSMPTISGYLEALDLITQKFNLSGTVTINDLINLPNIFTTEEKEIDDEKQQLLLATIDELADTVTEVRLKEGQELYKDFFQRLTILSKAIVDIETTSAQVIERKRTAIQEALAESSLEDTVLAETRKNALYLALDKMDINEEIVRFKTHLTSLKNLLDSTMIEKGKQIDFTLQECGREINTIAAKCSDAVIGSMAITIKVELEKMREQTQNII